ncbi:MAG: DUF4278 domain-containing protein [Cyanobacteria bacterium J06633_2]
MKLSYRGQSYRAPIQSSNGIETGLNGYFRGTCYPIMYSVHSNLTRYARAYQFRGVTYLK